MNENTTKVSNKKKWPIKNNNEKQQRKKLH